MTRLRSLVALACLWSLGLAAPAWASGYDGRDDCGGYSYDHGCRHQSGDRDNRDDNRRAGISPGPFDRSPVDIRDNNVTVCFPFSTCGRKDDKQPGDKQPGPQPKGVSCLVPVPFHCDPRPADMITDPRKLAQFPVTVVQMSLEFAQKIVKLIV